MTNLVLGGLVPLVSVLLGAGITYWLNIRTRRRSYVEELFNEAMSAVAVADASRTYMRDVPQLEHVNDKAYKEQLGSIARSAVEYHLRRCSEAQSAMARVLPYEPAIRPLYQDPRAVVDRTEEALEVLASGRDRVVGRRRAKRQSYQELASWPHHAKTE